PDAHLDLRRTPVRLVGPRERAERGVGLVAILVVDRVADEVRRVRAREMERAPALHLREHRTQDHVVAAGRGARGRGARDQRTDQEERARHGSLPYFSSSDAVGGGRIGGRSCDFCFFWISISVVSTLGATALTGTHPDSAPHTPSKTSGVSLVAMIFA